MKIDVMQFAQEWILAWNSRDISRILSHYSEDFEIITPMIRIVTGEDLDRLKGKSAVKKYWQLALSKFPDLKFELVDLAVGTDSVAIYYRSVMNKRGVEVMFLDEDNRICRAIAHYSLVAA